MPSLQTEVKQLLVRDQYRDVAEAIEHMAETNGGHSNAGEIFRAWDLGKRKIKDCRIAVSTSRSLQVTYDNFVGATRFKASDGQWLVRALRLRKGCGSVRFSEHFLACYEVPGLQEATRQEKVELIVAV